MRVHSSVSPKLCPASQNGQTRPSADDREGILRMRIL